MKRHGEQSVVDFMAEILSGSAPQPAYPEQEQELARAEGALAEIARSVVPVEPSRTLRERVLAARDPRQRLESMAARLAEFFDLGEADAREIMARIPDADREPWEERAPGVRRYSVEGGPRTAQRYCGIIRVDPGCTFPAHGHAGDEWALCLLGRAQEDTGRLLLPGDLVQALAGSSHSIRATDDEPFVFAVTLCGEIRFLRSR